MEGYKSIAQYILDSNLLTAPCTFTQLIARLTCAIGEDRNWTQVQEDLSAFMASTGRKHYIPLPDNGGFIFAGFFRKSEDPFRREGLLIHCNFDTQTHLATVATFVFPELPTPNGRDYYESSSVCFYLQDGYWVYEKTTTYADCADIHDHDHYDITHKAMYDYKNCVFYYPEEMKE